MQLPNQPPLPRFEQKHLDQVGRVDVFTKLMLFWAVVFVPIYALFGDARCAWTLVAGALIGVANLIAIHLRAPWRVCGNVLCLAAFGVYTALAYFCGGWGAPSISWYVSMPVLSLVVGGAVWAGVWTSASLIAISLFALLYYQGVQLETRIDPHELLLLHWSGMVGLVLCFFGLSYLMLRFEKKSAQALEEANRWLQVESSIDALTEIANRRYFDGVFEQQWQQHKHRRSPLTVAMIDLDYFKEFNDIYGHLAGDRVLRLIARAIQAGVRGDDFVARYGGEEFVVILPNTTEQQARLVIARVRDEISALGIRHRRSASGGRITISVGAAMAVPSLHDDDHVDLLRRADEALYRAKAQGRNRVECATDTAHQEPAEALSSETRALQQIVWDLNQLSADYDAAFSEEPAPGPAQRQEETGCS